MTSSFRPGLPLTLATLVAMAVLIGLGTWQVQRLAWKTALIAEIEGRSEAAPVALPETFDDLEAWNYRSVEVEGLWLTGTEQFMPAKVNRGELGEWLLQVLLLEDGRQVLVNRGWVPLCWREDTCRALPSSETVTVDGIIRSTFERGAMTPDNQPEQSSWYWFDLPAIEASLDIGPLAPVVVFVKPEEGMNDTPPVPQFPALRLRNDHLQYALTWYGLALVLAGVYIA